MSAAALEDALRAIGLDAEIEAHGAVAVVRLRGDAGAPAVAMLESAETRRTLVALAAEHGFRTLSLEVPAMAPVSHAAGERGVAD